MKTLVTGAGGMLAKDVVPVLSRKGHEVLALPREMLDKTDLEAVRYAVESFSPELIVNCAAYSSVDDAEEEEKQALMVNSFGVQNLCLACQENDIPLVQFSTAHVFDGRKASPYMIYDNPNPLGAYGRSRLMGERYVLWLLKKFYLIRTTWLFGAHGTSFVDTMLEIGHKQRKIPVARDQKGCPTWTCHLAEAAVDLIGTGRYGVYHITSSEPTTWYGFAEELFRLSGIEVDLIPVASDQFPTKARKPLNSVLDPFPLPQLLGKRMPSWRVGLKEYLRARQVLKG